MSTNILLFQAEKSSLYNGVVYAMRKSRCYRQSKQEDMDNNRILKLTQKFKERIRLEVEGNNSNPNDLKATLWKTLIMAEIAHRSFVLEVKIESFEKPYFNRQAAVGRLFCDWAMDWVAEYYYEISNYIAAFYWPDEDKTGFSKDYIPFKTFNLEE